ncbi:MAG: ABC transporter substrate-binding protein [Rhodocyclales bacterium]|nr:ABC transporter substrate-binding protein [Rhodocyclales bacterium]
MMYIIRVAALLGTLAVGTTAHAQITIGVNVSASGPAASLGIPERNTFALLPKTIAGEEVRWVVLDDGTDTATAVKNARKMVSEDNADVLIAATATPSSVAILEVAAETGTAQIAMAPVPPAGDKARWIFTTPQNFGLMASALATHMAERGVKHLGFIGYADPYGELWLKAMQNAAKPHGIELSAVERYQRNDTSVTGQITKIIAAKPDAVLVAGSGTPAVLPQTTLANFGYKGVIYQTHGIANRDFLRVGGRDVENTLFPVGPILLAEQLPDGHPSKAVALEYTKLYESAHGPKSLSTFGGHAYDAWLLLKSAIPVALKQARPGTPAFRGALRDALEGIKDMPGTHGVYSMSPDDHNGLDGRAAIMATIKNGDWKTLK